MPQLKRKNPKAPQFDRIAGAYDLLAYFVFGNSLKTSQTTFISEIPAGSSVLVVGGGSGYYLAELLKSGRHKKIVYVESSAKMIKLCRKKIKNYPSAPGVNFIHGDIFEQDFSEKFDVVVTHYFLDLLQENYAREIMIRLKNILKNDGCWICTDFKIKKQSVHRRWQLMLMDVMYLFFKITAGVQNKTLPDLPLIFRELGLKKQNHKEFYGAMIEAAVYKNNHPGEENPLTKNNG